MNRHRAALALFSTSFLALVLGATRAQPPPESSGAPSTGFEEVVEVNVVNLTVRVIDKKGNPVQGLARADFEIREDGKPVEIANFYEVAAGAESVGDRDHVEATEAAPEAPPAPVEPAPAAASTEGGAGAKRHVAVFVDNANLHPRNRKLVFRALREFLGTHIGPGDRIMVAAFRTDYEVVQPFTGSSADVVKAIDALERAPADGHDTLTERRLIVRDLGRANLTPFGTASGEVGTSQMRMRVESESRQTLQRIENVAFETRQRTLNSIGVLRYLLGSMAGLPEPKAILYLSDGLELRPAETLFQAHYNRFADIAQILEFDVALTPPQALAQEYDLSREFTALAADAQTANVAFFCLDASGQTDMMGGTAELAQRDVGSGAVPQLPLWTQRNDILTEQNLQSSLQLLASETGGAVLLNTRNYASFFDDLRASLDSYYSLGFQAPHDREGRRHQLEVRVTRPGLRVSYQRAYLDKSWETRLTEQTVATLVLGAPIGDMALRAVPGKSIAQGKKFVVPLQILVPVDALGLVPDGENHVASLMLTVVTKDARGNTRPAQITELRLRLTPEQRTTAENGEATIRLLLDPEPLEIGIGIRDRITGKSATTMVAVDPRV